MQETFDEFVYLASRPGLHPKYLFPMVEAGAKAIIIEGYHSGTLHACSEEEYPGCQYNLVPFLEMARERQVPVFLTFGPFIGKHENIGYEPFDEGKPGYETSSRMVKAGIVPLRANWRQMEEVCQKMKAVLDHVDDYQSVIAEMYAAFPFKAPLEKIQAAASE